MIGPALRGGERPLVPKAMFGATRLNDTFRALGPPLLFGLRVWASVCLALYVAFWLQLDNPSWAGTSAAIMCQPQLGASLRKGWFRIIGTALGAVAIVVLTACFPQDRALFLISLALWGALCTLFATILRNFAAYAAALAGYTAAIIASDQLGATGGLDGQAFTLALARVTEICTGIVSAGIVLAGTDLGGARRGLATLFAELTAGISAGFARSFTLVGAEVPDTRAVRRDFLRKVIALDPLIDQTLGESSQIRYHSPVLQTAVDGLFVALAAWRAVANHLGRLPVDQAREAGAIILHNLPLELQSRLKSPEPARWCADPAHLLLMCEQACRGIAAVPVRTPSLRLLADAAAGTLAGISHALNGLALLVADPARSVPRRGITHLRIPDWLPALVNAGRSFVTIGATMLFWIVTGWPSGATAITFASITAILLAPRADQAYAAAVGFGAGTFLATIFAAIIGFGMLPGLHTQTFLAFSLITGLYLVPAGALMAQWPTGMFIAMTANFVPLLGPTNPESYDTIQFYNTALAIVVGTGFSAFCFRLMPPLSPAFRTRRLLALTLRDLRRLVIGRAPKDWAGRIIGRLSAMPEQANPLERAYLLAAGAVGSDIIQLRSIGSRLGLGSHLEQAFAALAHDGGSAIATAHLSRLDAELAARTGSGGGTQTVLRVRGRILAMSEALTEHRDYFDSRAPG
ncbi:MAG: FUSC family protein [Acetobacteraceae bacterium]|nr:FUSC family protein [Acetobacteraceae bacterium]